MDDPVADRGEPDRPGVELFYMVHDAIERGGMVGQIDARALLAKDSIAVASPMNDTSVILTDAFGRAAGQERSVPHVVELVLDRRAPGVEYEDLHESPTT